MIDYSSYVFFGTQIKGDFDDMRAVDDMVTDLGVKDGLVRQVTLGDLQSGEASMYLALTESVVGGNIRYLFDEDNGVLEGCPIQTVDERQARRLLWEVFMRAGWHWEEPSWFMGVLIS